MEVTELFSRLGFTINLKKSVFNPSPLIDFLEFTIDTNSMLLLLSPEKVLKTEKACRHMLNLERSSPRRLAHLICLLTAAIPAVLPAPLHYRALQRARNQALRETQDYNHPCRLSPEAKQDLTWWIHSLHQHNGRSIIPPTAELIITSDASLEGWGASCRETQTGGVWSMEERQSHINLLELKAAFLALQMFASQRSNIHILLRIDNTTAIAYLNKKGGTHSRKLLDLAIQVWE